MPWLCAEVAGRSESELSWVSAARHVTTTTAPTIQRLRLVLALTTVDVVTCQPRECVLKFVEGQRPFDDDAAAVPLE